MSMEFNQDSAEYLKEVDALRIKQRNIFKSKMRQTISQKDIEMIRFAGQFHTIISERWNIAINDLLTTTTSSFFLIAELAQQKIRYVSIQIFDYQ